MRSSLLSARTMCLAAAVAMTALLAAPAVAQIDWHDSYEAALAAAQDSSKPIFAFVYISEQDTAAARRQQIRLQEGTRTADLMDLKRMLNQTLSDPEVVEAAGQFEAVRLDLRDPSTDAARRALKVSPGVDASGSTQVGMYPISVFLNSSGNELFRRHGCMPAIGYAGQLDRAADLHHKRQAIEEDPRDPGKRRELGRAYMEMDPSPEDRIYQSAVEHLEAAMRFDPDNSTGANFDARVDLAILRIPESPEEAIPALFQLQTEDEDDHRKLEIQYYMAVAHFAMEDFDSAKKLLREFQTNDRESPYWDSPWTAQALGLLEYIKKLER